MRGVVYLENELSASAFPAARTVMLELLSGQAAISLENARLYTDAQRANRAKDEFMAVLGHELRNPLAPILTACELMALRSPNALVREREVIDRQVKHMMRLVDDLLDVSRIVRGKIELVKRSVDLRDVVRQSIDLVTPLLTRSQIALELRLPSQAVPVFGDATRLAQVLSNVLTNAAKFSEPRTNVSLHLDVEDARAVLRVRDTGCGIAPELLPRVFDMFVQGDQQRDRTTGGLGLGLTIAKNLLHLHGGTIRAQSEGRGHGSQFIIELPLDVAPRTPADESAPIDRVTRGRRRRVMVVDDNVDAAMLLSDALQTMGHDVLVTHDAGDALARIEKFAPDLAILDIGLPVVDGFELARRIRALSKVSPRLVAVSGYAPSMAVGPTEIALFDEYFVKPVTWDRVARIIERA